MSYYLYAYKMKYLKVILSTLLLFYFSFCTAQNGNISGLLHKLASLHDSARVDCLNELAFEYSNPYWNSWSGVKIDSAVLFTTEAQKEAQQLHYKSGIGDAYQNLGMIAEQRGNYILSERYTRLALPLLEKARRNTQLNRAYVNLGWCAFNQGRYKEALNVLKHSLLYYISIKDKRHITMIYRMIAFTYLNLGYSENAFQYFQKMDEIKLEQTDILDKIARPRLKGIIYLFAGDTAKALFYMQQSANTSKALGRLSAYNQSMSEIYTIAHGGDSALLFFKKNIEIINTTIRDSLVRRNKFMLNECNIAEVYLSMKHYDDALAHMWKPLREFTSDGAIDKVLHILKNIAVAYKGKGNDEKILFYSRQLLSYAEKNGARQYLMDGYQLLWYYYHRKHLLPQAYLYHMKYSAIKDAIETDNYRSKLLAWDALNTLTEAEKKYTAQLKNEEEKNDARIALVNKEKQTNGYIFIIVIVIGILFSGFIIRGISLRRRRDQLQILMIEKNAQLEKGKIEQEVSDLQLQKSELKMEALRAQMNPHFIFNSLNAINRFILQNNKVQASAYLTKFSRLMRLILQNSQSAFISLESELDSLKLYLELEQLRFDYHFDFIINVDKELDTLIIKLPPLIIQPYVENAIWHGLMHKEDKGHLQIKLYEEANILCCIITDDGIGRKKAAELKSKSASRHKPMGMQITANRIAMLQQYEKVDTRIVINDLVLPDGTAGGTEIILKIPVCYD